MEQFKLDVELREKAGKGIARALRKVGKIPAVFYGKGQNPVLLSLNPFQLEKAVATKAGMNILLKLAVGQQQYDALIKDYQADTITRQFKHADFISVDLTKKMKVDVPVHLTGIPVGTKEGGILQQITRQVSVLCLPTHIPQEITVDVTELKLGQNLHLHDVKLPEGVEPVTGTTDLTIATIFVPREEEVAAPATDIKEPEVLTAKKTDEAAATADAAGKDGAKAKDAKK